MSIDKWISKESSKKGEDKKKDVIPKEKLDQLKKEKIRQLVGNNHQKKKLKERKDEKIEESDFFSYMIEFQEWLNKRTYLKGDLDKLEIWIRNLYKKLETEPIQESKSDNRNIRTQLRNQYKDIPPNFLDEKIRIAVNKKLHGMKGRAQIIII